MIRLKMTCIAVEERDGYTCVYLHVQSVDSTIYADGTIGIQVSIEEGQRFKIGSEYDTSLEEVTDEVATDKTTTVDETTNEVTE